MSGHTPGPWQQRPNPYDDTLIVIEDASSSIGYRVAFVIDANGYEQNQANARLIAAVPDLFDVVCRCELWLSTTADGKAMRDVCRAVITKATQS